VGDGRAGTAGFATGKSAGRAGKSATRAGKSKFGPPAFGSAATAGKSKSSPSSFGLASDARSAGAIGDRSAGRGGAGGKPLLVGIAGLGGGAFAAGRSGEITGRSCSSRNPSAAGKSDGKGAVAADAAGTPTAVAGRTGTEPEGAMPMTVFVEMDGNGEDEPGTPSPDTVCGRDGGGPAGACGAGAAPVVPMAPVVLDDGVVTKNECPHLGQRILRPAGGTRRSST
jgi:hypothetical protein